MGPRPANSKQDALGEQNEYNDGDGVGPLKDSTRVRQGFWENRVIVVLAISLALALIAYFVLQAVFYSGPMAGQ